MRNVPTAIWRSPVMARFKNSKVHWLQIVTHLGALTPLALMVWDFTQDHLTANPIQDLTFRTGKAALVLLVLSLACTPVNVILGYRPALKVRRALGLYAFMYVSLHFLIFVGLDYGFDVALLKEAIFEKRYALVGFAAFLILIPLAVTSTKGWITRLGKRWKQLHKLVYVAILLAVVHYVWLVKSDVREPLAYGAGVLLLLLIRVPRVRKGIARLRSRLLPAKQARSKAGRPQPQPAHQTPHPEGEAIS